MNEIALSYRDRINAVQRDLTENGSQWRDLTLRQLNLTREVGVLLDEAKSTLRGDQWKELQHELDFGPDREQAIQTFLTFARKNPEPISDVQSGYNSLHASMQVTGLLPFAAGHGPQVLHSPNVFSWWAKTLTSVRSERNKRLSREPIESWSPTAAEQFIAQTEPEVQELNALLERARERMEEAA